jgi:hypothetical protein
VLSLPQLTSGSSPGVHNRGKPRYLGFAKFNEARQGKAEWAEVHMLFLDGAYVDDANGSVARFQWVKAPTSDELTRLTHQIALRIGRFLERRGVLVRDAEDSYLTSDAVDEDPMQSLVVLTLHKGRELYMAESMSTGC